jgi:hypothetical protein
MGGGGPSTVTNKTELPPWLEDITKENLAKASEIADRPYVAYGGNLTAGFSPEMLQAFQSGMGGVGAESGAYKGAFDAATGASTYKPQTVTAQNFLQGDVGAYMNPYIQNVEDRAIQNAQRSSQMNINQIGANAARAGAFGGYRQGVSEGVAAAEAARGVGDLSAQLRSQAFQQAQSTMSGDQQRALQAAMANQSSGLAGAGLNLQAAGQLGNLAGQAQGSRLADLATMTGIGEAKQGMEQRLLDEQYARWLEERNAPIEGLNLRLAATSATPYGKTETQTRTGGGGSNFLTGIGAAGSAAAGIASLIGAL